MFADALVPAPGILARAIPPEARIDFSDVATLVRGCVRATCGLHDIVARIRADGYRFAKPHGKPDSVNCAAVQ